MKNFLLNLSEVVTSLSGVLCDNVKAAVRSVITDACERVRKYGGQAIARKRVGSDMTRM